MNRRDLKNFTKIDKLLDKDSEEEFCLDYMEDMADDLKNK